MMRGATVPGRFIAVLWATHHESQCFTELHQNSSAKAHHQ